MAKIDVIPLLPVLEEKLKSVWVPPFRIYEPFIALGTFGEVLKAAEPLATAGEYEEALTEIVTYFDSKYNLTEMADSALKWKGVLAPIELVDGTAIRYAIYGVGVPQLAAQLASAVG